MNYCSRFIFFIYTFASLCFANGNPSGRIKRESGVSPEQTRCCKLSEAYVIEATVFKWEGDISKE